MLFPCCLLCCPVLAMTPSYLCLDVTSTNSCYCISKLACMQVNMLEEVVRQLSHDLKLSEAQQNASSSSSIAAKEDVVQSKKGSPATQREVQALSARVCSDSVLTRILHSPISKQNTKWHRVWAEQLAYRIGATTCRTWSLTTQQRILLPVGNSLLC